jgi:hypothetical protein
MLCSRIAADSIYLFVRLNEPGPDLYTIAIRLEMALGSFNWPGYFSERRLSGSVA